MPQDPKFEFFPNRTSIANADGVREKVYSRADEIGVPRDVVDRLVKRESDWSHTDARGRVKRSPKNARGLFQVVPDRASIRNVGGIEYNVDDEDQNIEAGLRYYREGMDKAEGDHQLASLYYFGGPGAFETAKKTGKIPNISDGLSTAQEYTREVGGPKQSKPPFEFFRHSAEEVQTPPPVTQRPKFEFFPNRTQDSESKSADDDVRVIPREGTRRRLAFDTEDIGPSAKPQPVTATYEPGKAAILEPGTEIHSGAPTAGDGKPAADVTREFIPGAQYITAVDPGDTFDVSGTPSAVEQRKAEKELKQRAKAEKETASLRDAIKDPDKLVRDIRWHFGLGPNVFETLNPDQQRKIALKATRAAAEDEKKKVRGDELQVSRPNQHLMRESVGLRFNIRPEDPLPDPGEKSFSKHFKTTAEQLLNIRPDESYLGKREPYKPVGMGEVRKFEGDETQRERQQFTDREPIRQQLVAERNAARTSGVIDPQRPSDYFTPAGIERDIDERLRSEKHATVSYSDRAKSVVGSFAQGVAEIPAGLLDAVAITAYNVDKKLPAFIQEYGDRKSASELVTAEWAQSLRNLAKEQFPTNEKLQDSFVYNTVPQGIGSLLGFAGGGWISKSATLVPALLGAGVGMSAGYRDALQAGASEDDAAKSALLNGLVGTSEAVPVSRMLNRLDKATSGTLKHALVDMAKEGTEEALQEFFQSAAGNVIAKQIYDKERGYLEGVIDNASAGAVVGSIASLIFSAATKRRARSLSKNEQETVQDLTADKASVSNTSPENEPETKLENVAEIVRAVEPDAGDKRFSNLDDAQLQGLVSARPKKGTSRAVREAFSGKQEAAKAELARRHTEGPAPVAEIKETSLEAAPSEETPSFKDFVENYPRGGVKFDTLTPDDPLFKERADEYVQKFGSRTDTKGTAGGTVDQLAHEAAPSPTNALADPTDAQIEAGNYKKGHVLVSGIDLSIENPEGSERSGVDPNGNKWSVKMSSHYGYIKRSESADGEQVDAFLRPGTAPDYSGPIFVVNQTKGNGHFDEHKVMLGWTDEASAKAAYLENYDKGWDQFSSIARFDNPETLKKWLAEGDGTKPAEQKIADLPGKPTPEIARAESQAAQEEPLSVPEIVNEKPSKTKHEFSTAQVNLPDDLASQVKAIGGRIAKKDLAEDGVETDSHVTVKFGLHTNNAEDLRALLEGEAPFKVTIGKISTFPPSESSNGAEVLKIDVDSAELRRLNKKISDALPHTDTFEYSPHITLAYVKPGLAKKYVGKKHGLQGRELTLNSIAFSDKNGQMVEIPLKGSPEGNKAADRLRAIGKRYEAEVADLDKRTAAGRVTDYSARAQGIVDRLNSERESLLAAAPADLAKKLATDFPALSASTRTAGDTNEAPEEKPKGKPKQKSRRQPAEERTLTQAVIAAGGISMDRDGANRGEWKRLTSKESGRIGVASKNGRTAERMALHMAELGYRGDWVDVGTNVQGQETFDVDGNAFLAALEDDVRGIKVSHSRDKEIVDDYEQQFREQYGSDQALQAIDKLYENELGKELIDKVVSGQASEEEIEQFEQLAQQFRVPESGTDAIVDEGYRAQRTDAETAGVQGAVENEEEGRAGDPAQPQLTDSQLAEGYTLATDGTLIDPGGQPLFRRPQQLGFTQEGLLQQETQEPDRGRLTVRESEEITGALAQLRDSADKQIARIARVLIKAKTIARDEVGNGAIEELTATLEKFEHIRGVGLSVDEYMKQGTLFAGEPQLTSVQEGMLGAFEKYASSGSKLQQLVFTYVREISNFSKMSDAELGGPQAMPLFQRAFHGSPHTFDKFSTAKIGTGEGNQSFGWGLYFADKKEIAQHYKGTLAIRPFLGKVQELYGEFDSPQDATDEVMEHGDWSETERALLDAMQQDDWMGFDYPHQAVYAAFTQPQNLDMSPATKKAIKAFGRVYEVELAPEEDDYLLWDKPLNEQSEKVKKALASIGQTPLDLPKESRRLADSGQAIYRTLRDQGPTATATFKQHELYQESPAQWASQHLHSLGIRGIKYLDQGSRDERVGTYNYVIFSDDDVSIQAMFKRGESGIATWLKRRKAQLQSLRIRNASTDVLLKEAKVEGAPHRLKLNEPAYEIFKRLYEQQEQERTGKREEHPFTGVFNGPPLVRDLLNRLKQISREHPAQRNQTAALARALKQAAETDGTAILYTEDEALIAEYFHRASYLGSGGKSLVDRHANFLELAASDPVKKAGPKLIERGYPDDLESLVEELAEHIWDGDYESLGLTKTEAMDFLEEWFESYTERNGKEAFDEFRKGLAEATDAITGGSRAPYQQRGENVRGLVEKRQAGTKRSPGRAETGEGGSSGPLLKREPELDPRQRVFRALLNAKQPEASPRGSVGGFFPRESASHQAPKAQPVPQPAQTPPPNQPPPNQPPPTTFTDEELLAEVDRILEDPEAKSYLGRLQAYARKLPAEFQRMITSEFTPLRLGEKQLVGKQRLDLAAKAELLPGASGQAELDLLRFQTRVVAPIAKLAPEFNRYLLGRRIVDRLSHDPNRKRVAQWTIPKAEQMLAALKKKVGDVNWKRLEKAAAAFQQETDAALQLRVDAGLISQKVYDAIKASSDFYAPFKVMKYVTEQMTGGGKGTGRRIPHTEDLIDRIKGIEDEDFQLQNFILTAAQQIYQTRILAEKNRFMLLDVAPLADADPDGEIIRHAQPTRYYRIEYKPAEETLSQLSYQKQPIEQSLIKVGRAIELAEAAGLHVKRKALVSALGRGTLGGMETGGGINLKAFTSEVIAHELGHTADVAQRDSHGERIYKSRNVFGTRRDILQRLSSEINTHRSFQKEMAKLVDFTGLGGDAAYRASAKERFSEFVALYIHNPKKARELAPTWTDHFELNILPNPKIKQLVEGLANFFQKVDALPNILTPLKELDNNNYLELAIRRAFPDRAPQLGVRFGDKPRPGYKIEEYLDAGTVKALEVRDDFAKPLEGLHRGEATMVSRAALLVAQPFKWGATTFNLAFQPVNLFLADLPRAALISKYGVRRPEDLVRFPADWTYAFFTAMAGNFGFRSDLYEEFMKSGAYNSTIQRELTPEAFKPAVGVEVDKAALPKRVLYGAARFGSALEETSKILGLVRGKRFENLASLSPEQQIERMREIASEVRRFSGSPDFWRKGIISTGQTLENMNLLFMFLNARIQGTAADLARLSGRAGGGKLATAAWLRLSLAVGIPALSLMLYNLDDDDREIDGPEGPWKTTNRESYKQVPGWEQENYFMIPRNQYFMNDRGERVRDYWKIPKREIVKLFGNLIEAAVQFADNRDPAHLRKFGVTFLENLSPINVSGTTPMERAESGVGSLNPILKTPAEMIFNRDTFRHRKIVPDYIDKVASKDLRPEEQYTRSTAESFVRMGKLLGVSPLLLEHGTRGFTAGLVTQFMPPKPQPGRSPILSYPAIGPIARRFVRSESTAKESDNEILDEALKNQATERVTRNREAYQLYQSWKKNPGGKDLKGFLEERNVAPNIGEQALSLKEDDDKNLTRDERAIKQLGVDNGERTEFLRKALDGKTEEQRQRLIDEWREKGLASREVLRQLRLSNEELKKQLDQKARHEILLKAARQRKPTPTQSGIKPRSASAP